MRIKASKWLKMFGWCGATVTPNQPICITVGDEEFELFLASNHTVKWRLRTPKKKYMEIFSTAHNKRIMFTS